MKQVLQAIILPKQISDFERKYLARMNRVGLVFFALHIPVFAIVAYFNDTGPLLAVALTLAVMAGPALAMLTFRNPRMVSVSYGFTSMLMGGLLVHFGQGPVQIEMHFYFFALLAMLALYGNPLVIIVAAVTVALHHLFFWMYLPSSVFNYAAPIWVVAVHAGFVVLESAAGVFIARSFFENVIGLEKIVNQRTAQLDTRNRDMRLVLDNVQQGFITIGLDGKMSKERSRVVEQWLGPADEAGTLATYLEQGASGMGDRFECAWMQVEEGLLPFELTLDQMPKRMASQNRHFSIDYIPILAGEDLQKVLVVLSDITSELKRERLEAEQREALHVFHRIADDKAGFLEFFDEAELQVSAILADDVEDRAVLKRIIHTLKGNSGLFRLQSIADLCHQMESHLVEEDERPSKAQLDELARRWESLCALVKTLLGEGTPLSVELDEQEYKTIVNALLDNAPRERLLQMVNAWKLDPTRRRLDRVAEQAQGIAARLDKPELIVDVQHHDLRLEPQRWAPFWAAFVHVVRNAIDHGIESAEEREKRGKSKHAKIVLSTRLEGSDFVVEIEDDGRGIDWAAIAKRAEERGLPAQSHADLVEALFSDGISTKQTVSEFSGRGIGMGAARAACQKRGGTMLIHSEGSGGTRIEFRFPRSQMADEPEARLVA